MKPSGIDWIGEIPRSWDIKRIKYIAQFGFGYLAAYIPAVIITCRLLKERYSFSDMVKAAIAGVLVIHVIGILYMAAVALFRHAGFMFVGGWIAAQSGLKIIYDILFSYMDSRGGRNNPVGWKNGRKYNCEKTGCFRTMHLTKSQMSYYMGASFNCYIYLLD